MEYVDMPATRAETTRDAGTLERFDGELEGLEHDLDALMLRIGPVLSQYADTAKLAEPRPEPASQIRGRVERLANLRAALNDITARVDL